jgi:hypothetical protein
VTVSLHCLTFTGFIHVHEHCVADGLQAHLATSNTAGYEEVSIFCKFSVSIKLLLQQPVSATNAVFNVKPAWLPQLLLVRNHRHYLI